MNIQAARISKYEYTKDNSRNYLENILAALDSKVQNKLDDLVWQIKNLTINFSTIKALENSHSKWIATIPIDIVVFSKIIFLANVQNYTNSGIIRYKFDSIIKTLYYLANNNIQIIEQDKYEKFLSFFLMNRIEKNKTVIKLSPLSYQNYSNSISNRDWYKTLMEFRLPILGFDSNFSESFVNKSLKSAVEYISDGDIGFGDWKAGGNFNRLTLDYGRYYIHHCSEIFEKHIGLAIALRKTLTQAGEIAANAGLKVNKNNLRTYVMLVIGHFLAGKQIEDLPEDTLNKYSTSWFESIQNSTINIFKNNLNRQNILDKLLTDKSLSKISAKACFEIDHEDKRDWLKHLISIRWSQFAFDSTHPISILRTKEFNYFCELVGHKKFYSLINAIDFQYFSLSKILPLELPTPVFFSNLGLVEKGSQSKFVNNFLRFVESAGAVKFAGLTGWRESEYGFGINNIACCINQDILDQFSNPLKFEINWVIPKTNGGTHLKREITYGAYLTAIRLSALVESGEDLPCLYSFNENMVNPNSSKEIIPRLISFLWSNFVLYYPDFQKLNLIDELNSLTSKSDLGEFEIKRLSKLQEQYKAEQWDVLEIDINLRDAKSRSIIEFDRVKFLIEQDARRDFVWNYRMGSLNPAHKSLLDNFLTVETKKIISNFQLPNEISAVFTRSVINEIIQDCLYPTPHAFRHMWAEAVYRRFDGDAGWMIRSSFKHISPSMWLSYIRGKDNRRQHERIKRHVISSILNNYIKKIGQGYAGPLDKLLRRLFNITYVTKPTDIASLVEQFADNEIESIKSTNWGFCLLMKRNKANAKCAEQGIPQRHKASPALCLGCNNNLIQIGNIEGILLGISNDLNVIKEPNMPESFFNESFKTVTNAFKHLTKLKADQDTLNEIDKCLKTSLKGRI